MAEGGGLDGDRRRRLHGLRDPAEPRARLRLRGVLPRALLLFCAALPVGIGVALVRGRPRRHLAADEAAWSAELLRLARRQGGNLTVAEVVADVDLPPEEAERHLERLCLLGLAEHRVSESGVIVYRVAGLLTGREKRRAVGVLDG